MLLLLIFVTKIFGKLLLFFVLEGALSLPLLCVKIFSRFLQNHPTFYFIILHFIILHSRKLQKICHLLHRSHARIRYRSANRIHERRHTPFYHLTNTFEGDKPVLNPLFLNLIVPRTP